MLRHPLPRVTIGVALVLLLPLVAMQFSDSVVWSLGDFVVAGVLLAILGTVLELAVRRTASLAVAVATGLLGIAAAVFGEADDAPGMVLLGLALVAGAVALGVRRVSHR